MHYIVSRAKKELRASTSTLANWDVGNLGGVLKQKYCNRFNFRTAAFPDGNIYVGVLGDSVIFGFANN